jgi:hypothetical protein
VLLGHLVTLSAGFSAGDKRVIAKSNRSGVTSSSCTCSNASYSINAVSNITSYALGDYVQISAGWPSATAAYRITIIDTANLRLTVDAISTSAQTGITLTQVKGITVNSNATGTNAKIYVTTTDPTFGYFGTITDGKYQSGDTLRAGSATAYAQLDSVNGILLGGTTKVWDDIRINPGSFDRPGTSDPSLVAAGSTYLWEFQKNDSATVTVQFPHSYSAGDTVYIHLHWTPATRGNEEGTATVGWKAGYTWASIDSVFPAWTVADLSDTCENTDWDHLYTQDIAIPGPGKFESSMMLINVKRTDTGADDTWASAVSGQLPILLELDIHYPINKLGTDDH